MKQTLLEIVQGLLASMDSDEVNSISDTVESYDMALLLRDVYYDIAVELDLTAHQSLFELDPSNDSSQPTLMYLPDEVSKLHWVKYNNQLSTETNSNYKDVLFVDFDDFFSRQSGYIFDTTNVGEMTFCMNDEDFEVMYATDRFPSFFTAIGNNTLLFNAVNQTEDTTLEKAKTMCSGLLYPIFTLEDSFIPDLDPAQFPYYRNRAKVRAFGEKKQVENREAASEARNQKILMQKRKNRINEGIALKQLTARYGRK